MPTLEARVEVLEKESTQMRDEWQVTQRVIQGQAGLLNALRETQLEHTSTLKVHSSTLDEHSAILKEHGQAITDLRMDFAGLRTEVGELRTEFHGFRDEVRLGFAGIAQSLDYLIKQDGKSRS